MQKTVLITGASSGIGADSARLLIAEGFNVVVTVRKSEDEAALVKQYKEKIKIVKIDLTQFSEIEKLPQILGDLGVNQIYGLINNAGVALAAPFLHQPFSEIQQIFNVNVLGVMKVTQVLIPMIEKNGRIINISSVAGKSAAPFLAIYAASKHAIEGFSEALRKELILLGIKVIIVAPGSIKTPIWQKGFTEIKDAYNQTAFAKPFSLFMKFAQSEVSHALEVSEVSSVILEALNSENPKLRYAPIPRKLMNWYFPKLIPAKLYDYLTAKTLGLLPK